MKAEDLTVLTICAELNRPVTDWIGKCYAISCAIVEAGLVEGRAVYGHWDGDVSPDCEVFSPSRIFQRHGWIVLNDGRVLDPTRWVFEAVDPYLWIGEAGEEYDRGGDRWRAEQEIPPPAFPNIIFEKMHRDSGLDEKLPEDAQEFVGSLLGGPPHITLEQAMWLANRPLSGLGPFAKEIFEGLVASDHGAFIPIDNRTEVLG